MERYILKGLATLKMNIPSREECLLILKNNGTPSRIIQHTIKVAEVAAEVADRLAEKGVKVNKALAVAGALLHDIEKDKDDHSSRGAELLEKLGFPEVAKIIRYHSYYDMEKDNYFNLTAEQKIVFYADKRVMHDKRVSIKKRYEDLKKRYDFDFSKEQAFAEKLEKELG